jgi:para-aminobenzoate synthetase component 1
VRKTTKYTLQDENFQEKLLQWAEQFPVHCFLNSSKLQHLPDKHSCLAGVDTLEQLTPVTNAFGQLKNFYEIHKDWLFGFLSYDLKNETENLSSSEPDVLGFPLLHFFKPRFVFEIIAGTLFLHHYEEEEVDRIYGEILGQQIQTVAEDKARRQMKTMSGPEIYNSNVAKIQHEIYQGRVYEINYCIEYFLDACTIDPLEVYKKLNTYSPTPFSCYYKLNDHYLISASPERFLKKTGNRLLSQPIKGTIRRGVNETEDQQLKTILQQSEKERAENIMIVDLVRNDLSQTAQPGSVVVEELCEIYSFQQVHQMISTISSTLKKEVHFVDAIKSVFPMGSMTGAPKINAMKLIEAVENTKRGLYSGAVGYITPNGDFDFNVVIRSIQYNRSKAYLNFMVGSAITASSIADQEYKECLVKASAMLKALNAYI